jgi:hypothetical protein
MKNSVSPRIVNAFTSNRIASRPLDEGMIARFGQGLSCQKCTCLARGCDVEPLESGFRIPCHACHHIILSYEPRR